MALTFEWDERKAEGNRAKHGVAFDEAITVFNNPVHGGQPASSVTIMKKTRAKRPTVVRESSSQEDDDILPQYDFSRARRNPYAARFRAGVTVVLLEPDVAESFPDSQAVNHALRSLLAAVPKRSRRSRPRTA